MTIKITTVGTGTAFPSSDRGPSCNLIQYNEKNIVVDLGSGSLQKLCSVGVYPLNIDYLFLTHNHLDHINDVLPLIFAVVVPGYWMNRTDPISIICSNHTKETIFRMWNACCPDKDLNSFADKIEFTTIDTSKDSSLFDNVRSLTDGVKYTYLSTEHCEGSVGFKFYLTTESVFILAVPGDSAICSNLVDLCSNCDMAILECSMPDYYPLPGHLSPKDIFSLCEKSPNLKNIQIVHQYPFMLQENVKDILDGAFKENNIKTKVEVPNDLYNVLIL